MFIVKGSAEFQSVSGRHDNETADNAPANNACQSVRLTNWQGRHEDKGDQRRTSYSLMLRVVRNIYMIFVLSKTVLFKYLCTRSDLGGGWIAMATPNEPNATPVAISFRFLDLIIFNLNFETMSQCHYMRPPTFLVDPRCHPATAYIMNTKSK